MVQSGEYTKEEIASLIGTNDTKASNICRKLKQEGYTFTTSGKGRTYKICIYDKKITLREFAREYLGIYTNDEDKLREFLSLLIFGKEKYISMPYSCMEWYVNISRPTIRTWMEALIECGLFKRDVYSPVYYATKKIKEQDEISDVNEWGANYKYYRHYKLIDEEEYSRAQTAYDSYLGRELLGIKENPDKVEDEVYYMARIEKMGTLDYWWSDKTAKISINKWWEHYDTLLSLLDKKARVYRKRKNGNLIDDENAHIERLERWEKMKAEKRKKLLGYADDDVRNTDYYKSEKAKLDEIEKELKNNKKDKELLDLGIDVNNFSIDEIVDIIRVKVKENGGWYKR